MEVLKVSAKSVPNSVAGAIAGVIRDSGSVEVQAVGAGATNQAVKAIAIARGYLAPAGMDLVCVPTFGNIIINNRREDGDSADCRAQIEVGQAAGVPAVFFVCETIRADRFKKRSYL